MAHVAEHHRVSLDHLIEKAQSSDLDDTGPMNEIIRRFEPLADRLARHATRSRYLHDDLRNAARVALVRAVRRHKPQQLGFPAFAEIYMRGAVRREYERWLPPEREDESATPAFVPGGHDVDEVVLDRLSPWGAGVVATVVGGLAPSQKWIAQLRYVEDAPLERIAAVTGTTSSAVSQRLATIHRAVAAALAAA
jgi:RNA polymerase sigma factor (sigma-70 family)